MNYHVEHHMFPLVTFDALAKIACRGQGRLIHSLSKPLRSAVVRNCSYDSQAGQGPRYITSNVKLPEAKSRFSGDLARPPRRCPTRKAGSMYAPPPALRRADVLRFDYGKKTYALYRDEAGQTFRY